MYYYDTYYFLLLAVVVISFIVQGMVNSRFEKYSKVATRTGMTGREVAEKILRDAESVMLPSNTREARDSATITTP